MADSTVSTLTAASALDGTELFYGVQGGADRKVAGSQIKTLVGTPGGAPTGSAGGDLAGSYPNPTLGFASASAAAVAADADTFPTNQGAGTLKQTLAAVKTWIKAWIVKGDVGLGNVDNTSDATKNAASVTLTNKTLTSPVINTPTGIVKGDVGLGLVGNVKNNFGATTSPGVSDDSASSYSAGSQWLNINTSQEWTCRSASVGAAKWILNGSVDLPSYIANSWYGPTFMTGVGAVGSARASGTIYAFPIFIFERCTLHALAVRVTTLDGGAVGAQLSLHNNSATNRPGIKVASLGSQISLASVASVSGTLSSDQQIERGWYWLAIQTNSTTAVFNSFLSNISSPIGMFMGTATLGDITGSTLMVAGVSTTGTYASDGSGMGDLTGATFTELGGAAVPMIYYQVVTFP